jgi:hypothetical protein
MHPGLPSGEQPPTTPAKVRRRSLFVSSQIVLIAISSDMEWDEMDNYSLQYCFEGDDDDDSEGDEMDEELDEMAGSGEDIPKTGSLMDQSAPASQETSITRQISGAAMDFVRRSSMSN